MHIIDLITKQKKEVTNLEEALKQADTFRNYIVKTKYNKERVKYWNEVYLLLSTLKNNDEVNVVCKTVNPKFS